MEKHFFECMCGHSVAAVSWDEWDEYTTYASLVIYGEHTAGWKDRLRHIWSIVKHGHPSTELLLKEAARGTIAQEGGVMERPKAKCTARVVNTCELKTMGEYSIYFYAPADVLVAVQEYGTIRSWRYRKNFHTLQLDLRYEPDEVIEYINSLGKQPFSSQADIEASLTGKEE